MLSNLDVGNLGQAEDASVTRPRIMSSRGNQKFGSFIKTTFNINGRFWAFVFNDGLASRRVFPRDIGVKDRIQMRSECTTGRMTFSADVS